MPEGLITLSLLGSMTFVVQIIKSAGGGELSALNGLKET
jgi:hypothetical protein